MKLVSPSMVVYRDGGGGLALSVYIRKFSPEYTHI